MEKSEPLKGMILAAGRGTRLRPLTDSLPKALAPVLGVAMLERLRAWLGACGVAPLAINLHHHADVLRAHLRNTDGAGTAPRQFHELELLGTGGALVNAREFWEESELLLWNGDILADVDPAALRRSHRASSALATLVVQERPSDSRLLVDAEMRVCGIASPRRGRHSVLTEPVEPIRALAFNGISLLSPQMQPLLLALLPSQGPPPSPPGGAFDLVDALMEVIGAGERVCAFDAGEAFFGTTGTPERLRALEQGLAARPALLARWTP